MKKWLATILGSVIAGVIVWYITVSFNPGNQDPPAIVQGVNPGRQDSPAKEYQIDYKPILKKYLKEFYEMRDAWGLDQLNVESKATNDIEEYKSWYNRLKRSTDEASTPNIIRDLISDIGAKVEDPSAVKSIVDNIISIAGPSVTPEPN